MKYKVDGWNNFCRVFELPDEYPEGYCFDGGHPVNFQLVDWFNPVADVRMAAVSKEVWVQEVGEIQEKEVELAELIESLTPFLAGKCYTKEHRQYLVMCDFGATFLFTLNPELLED